ncbi:Carboxylic ester hydrolase [Mycena sanguinolenta]|uniref:Carboxylic ester hydrolase n=1 Tax=Mycena sanguinolenta TaxID=230812 RepID=A0A8H6ZDG2_9AGAR|nr:Carboxylic ester hydrolase [Mycena sanguinolenta]
MFQLPFLLSAALAVPCLASGEAPTVTLNYGVFQGAVNGNLSTFLGVPFAKPSVRFSLPERPALLHGVQNATAFGPACPQQALTLPPPIPPLVSEGQVSEDCLKLNVFAPKSAKPGSNLPVFVWIYGGGFEIGNSPDTEVRPVVERSLATGEPIIIVTPNYRVSAFGFLAGKEVGDAGISNLGLRDQIFALEWVQEHIQAFGGDPNRVVIGGPSAGAISTGLLLLSNKRFEPTDLFRGAFMLSGSPITTGSVTDGQPYYDGLVAANNCTRSSDTLDCLRRVPFDAFMATVNDTTNLFSYSSLQNIWRPRVDGDIVIQDPLISVSKGLYANIPIISGDSDDEGTEFSLSNDNITTNEEFLDYIHSNYLSNSTSVQIAKLGTLYPNDPTQGSPFDTGTANQLTPQFKRLAAFQGDYLFVGGGASFWNTHRRRKMHGVVNKHGKSTPILGAAHGSDVPLWFPPSISNATDFVPVDALINFINTLNPNRSLKAHNTSTIYWPKWNELMDGSPSLFTLSDPDALSITPEDFRVDAIQFLFEVLLQQAEKSA